MKHLQLLTLFSLLLFFGCSSSNDEDPADELLGSFKATISGDLSMALEGEAYFLHAILTSKTDDENGSTIGITLTDENDEENMIIVTVVEPGNLNGIGVGTYSVTFDEEDEDTYASVAMYTEGSLTTFLAISGEVKLTKVEDDQVEGTITATLTNFKEETINITGNYKADGMTQKL
jgi:hypothetical protein